MSPEDFLDTLTSNSPSFVMVLDRKGLIRFVNRTTRDLSKAEVLGEPIFNYAADQQEIDKLQECFNVVTQTKKTQLLENKALSPEAVVSYWESRVSPIIEADEVTGFILFTNNITKEKAARQEQEAIFNLSPDFLCVLKFDGYFSRVNPAFIEKLGYTEEELLKTPYIDLIHPDDQQMSIDIFTRVTEHFDPMPLFENRCVSKEGKAISIEWRGTIDVEASRVVGIGRDVTATRELEQQLRQAQKMDAIGQLAGGIAHDFNNLLMAISANAEMGLFSDDLDSSKTRFRDIEAAAARAAQLTGKLLTFSREQPLQKKPLDLNHLIQNFLRLLERVLPANILLRFEPEVNLPHIAGDKSQLEQVLMNLCVNASDAMADGGSITVRTGQRTSADKTKLVYLDVSDTGSGIADSIKEKIYNPFFTTKSEGKGTGLGLSMIYSIMQKHQGSIDIVNSSSSGTTMQVCFTALKKVKAPENAKNQSLPFGGWETLLVAEDEALVAKITKETLEKAGYKVLSAGNGLEAVELCANDSSIRLVFMDVMMPQMGGIEAAAIIKQTRPEVPVLFASGYAPDTHKSIQSDYIILNKPYRGDELLNTIRTLLDAKTGS